VFLWNDALTTKLLYGSAFKAPSPQMLYASPLLPGDIIGNPELRPQYIHTVELAQSWRPAKYISLQSTLAYNRINDKVEFVPSGINIMAENMSYVQGISWENGVNLAYRDILTGRVSMEFQWMMREPDEEDYRSTLVGTQNIIAPPWIFRAGFSTALPFLQPLPVRVGSEILIAGARRATSENIVENGDSYLLPDYALLDAIVAVPDVSLLPVGKTTFSFKMTNLLDATGPDPGFSGVDYPLMGRRLMFDVRQSF
jgi:iron complex outermembrane receptor protein